MGQVLGSEPASIGSVLDAGFRLFRHAYGRIFPIVVAATALSLLYQLIVNAGSLLPLLGLPVVSMSRISSGEISPATGILLLLAGVVGAFVVFILLMAAEAAALHRAYQCDSDAGSLRESWRVGLRRGPRLLGLGLLIALVLLVPMAVAGAVAGGLWAAGLHAVAGVIGLALLCAVIYVASRLFLSTPEVVLRDQRIVESMKSSWRLTNGRLNRMGVLFVVIMAITIVFYVIWGVVAALIAGALFGLIGAPPAIVQLATVLFVGIAPLFVTPYRVSATVAVWHDFLLRAEGTDISARIAALPAEG